MSYEGGFVQELTRKDFDPPYLKNKECALVLIYLPECPHCQALEPIWNKLGMKATFFKVYAVSAHNKDLIKTLVNKGVPIDGYPTILLYKYGRMVEEYLGKKDINSMMNYILKNC